METTEPRSSSTENESSTAPSHSHYLRSKTDPSSQTLLFPVANSLPSSPLFTQIKTNETNTISNPVYHHQHTSITYGSPLQPVATAKSSHPLANNININNVPNLIDRSPINNSSVITIATTTTTTTNTASPGIYSSSSSSSQQRQQDHYNTIMAAPHLTPPAAVVVVPNLTTSTTTKSPLKSSPRLSPDDVISYQRVKKVIVEHTGIDEEIEARENYLNHLRSIDLSKYSFPNE